jgi:peptide/nickel transport system substrate-binding protein
MSFIRKTAMALAAVAVLASGYTPSKVEAKESTATYAMYADIKDWDPAIAFSLEVIMLANVYEPLIWYNAPGSKEQFTPALAKSWSVSGDGLTWTFNLRAGVKFHDGEPFNAAAAKASIDRVMTMKKGAHYIWSGVTAVEAADANTLVIKTKNPMPIDLIASSQYAAYMVSPKAQEKGTDWFNQGNAAGTGAYSVRQWAKGQQVVLEKNADYWGGWKAGQFDRVILKFVKENATQVQMLKSGEADFISLVPADAMEGLNKDPAITAQGQSSWKNSQFLINTKKAPTDNVKFRQALTHIWDYDSVVNDIYAGNATVAKGIIPASLWGHNANLKTPSFDLAKAKKLIAESGVPAGQRKITMAYIGTSEEYKNSALLFQANAKELGVDVELMPGTWGVVAGNARKLESAPNMQSMTWWPTYATPNDWLISLFKTEKKTLFNMSYYSNPAYDKLVDEGVALEGSDRATAIAKYGEAQQMLIDDATAIFYADIKSRKAYRSNVSGYEANPAYDAVFFHRLGRN